MVTVTNDDVWRQHGFEWCVGGCFAICSVKPRTVLIVIVVEGSFDELCDAGFPRCVLLGINLPILLVMVRHERCFAVENIGKLLQFVAWHYHSERCHQ